PRMGAQPMPDVAVIVVVAHQRGDVPTDPAEEAAKASHCFCTSFSAAVVIRPDGAKIRDGTGSSSEVGTPSPRRWRITITAPAATTVITSSANTIDKLPWMNVLRMTSSISPGVFAAPNAVWPAALASRYWKCCVQ